jgi:hypothetical protein
MLPLLPTSWALLRRAKVGHVIVWQLHSVNSCSFDHIFDTTIALQSGSDLNHFCSGLGWERSRPSEVNRSIWGSHVAAKEP